MNFGSYIKACVVLGKSQTQICADLHAASPSSAPSVNIVFRWFSHLFSLVGILVYMKGKMKNKTKSNEKLMDRVKAMVDEDARIAVHDIAEALAISSGSVLNIFGRQTPLQQGT